MSLLIITVFADSANNRRKKVNYAGSGRREEQQGILTTVFSLSLSLLHFHHACSLLLLSRNPPRH